MEASEVREAVTRALELWSQGNQAEAVNQIRPVADQDEPMGLILISWFLYQMGERWREGVPYAERASAKGMAHVINYYYGNMLNDPNFRGRVPDLIRHAIEGGWAFDPLSNVMQPFQAGDRELAVRMVEVATLPRPYPDAWNELIDRARVDSAQIAVTAGEVASKRDEAVTAIEAARTQVDAQKTTVETRTKQLLQLIA